MNRVTCLVLMSLLFPASMLRADGTSPPPMPTPLKLDAALRQARPDGIALAVGAAKVSLPAGAVLPGDPMTGQEIGALYGQATQPFGSVLAVAPPTITVVHTPPETPNPYDGMPPGQVMKLLAATFTPAQWKAFMSPAGIAYADMAGDTQPPLFRAMFPDGHLVLIQDNPAGENDPKTKQDLSGDTLSAAHLRLGSMTSLALQMRDEPGGHTFAAGLRPANTPPRYFMMNAQSSDVDKEYGALVRETIPNAPKPGQLEFDDPALKAAVPLAGIRTVDDLIIRIGVTLHRELYADPRYGSRLVTLTPSSVSPTAPAGDLLQALAFCVGGTYRRVGPAYVLTDDVVGLGTKHVLWKAFEDKATKMLPDGPEMFPDIKPVPDVPYTLKDIPTDGDPLAMTPKQKDSYWKKWALNPGQTSAPTLEVEVPFAQLSPAQQEAAQMEQDANEKSNNHTTLDGTVMVQTEPEVEVMLPSLDGPVVIFQSYQSLLPYPALTPTQEQAQQKRMETDFPGMAADPGSPSPDFTQTLRGFSRRAARMDAPKTAKEAFQSFAALQALGFNEAWISVQPGPASGDNVLQMQIARAVAEGRKRGIVVYPDLSLLHWPQEVSPDLLDRDIQGRTVFPHYNAQSPQTVSPFVPAAALRLAALIHALGSVPGIGGMVWDDISAAGYEKSVPGENIGDNPNDSPLGYADAGRLAFLRVDHADPVDVCDNSYTDERAHVHVPDFDSDFDRERRLFEDWKQLRADASQSFMHRLAQALPPPFTGAMRLPLLLPPSNVTFANSYGSWDSLTGPAPIVHFIAQTGPDGQPVIGAPSTERLSSVLAYTKAPMYLPPGASAEAWKSGAALSLTQEAKRGNRNVLLDLTDQSALLQDTPKNGKPQ